MPTYNSAEELPSYHFCYGPPTASNLQQGDILRRTEDVLRILSEVHPHYLKPDYTHFMVVTQTCDLVRRGVRHCRSRYITLAAVRPFSLVLAREIEKYQEPLDKTASVCSNDKRQSLEQFLERLLNNNESDYFYLHEDSALGFSERSCAFLRLSIPLRSHQHYDACMQARLLSLTDVFQAKLGWLIGNIYSRVGTEDWVPEHLPDKEFRAMIRRALDETCAWVDEKRLKAARKSATEELLQSGRDTARRHIDAVSMERPREVILGRVVAILRDLGCIQDDAADLRIRRHLNNDPEFASIMRRYFPDVRERALLSAPRAGSSPVNAEPTRSAKPVSTTRPIDELWERIIALEGQIVDTVTRRSSFRVVRVNRGVSILVVPANKTTPLSLAAQSIETGYNLHLAGEDIRPSTLERAQISRPSSTYIAAILRRVTPQSF